MDNTINILLKKLIQERPSFIFKDVSFCSTIEYNRNNRTYTFSICDEDSKTLRFRIWDNTVHRRILELLIKDDRLFHEIKYKIEDWISIFESEEIDLLEDNIVVEKPQGMESLLEEDKDE